MHMPVFGYNQSFGDNSHSEPNINRRRNGVREGKKRYPGPVESILFGVHLIPLLTQNWNTLGIRASF